MFKNMCKKALIGAMAGVMVLTSIPVHAEGADNKILPFEDVSVSDWFYDAVAFNYESEIMIGVDETHFEPHQLLSRAQCAMILYRMDGEPEMNGENPFTDVTGEEWYGKAVLWAAEKGIVTGYPDGSFRPMDEITREQMSVMMHRFAKYNGYDVSSEGDYTIFDDSESVSNFAKEAMEWAVGIELIKGRGENLLVPKADTKRAEAATIMQRFINTSFLPAFEFELPEIVKNGTAVDGEGILTYVQNDAVEDNLMQDLYLFQNQLLLSSYSGTTLDFEMLSLETGEILHKTSISMTEEYSYSYNVQICGDKIAIAETQGGKLYILDNELNKIDEYEISGDCVYVNTKLTEAYSISADSGIQKIDLETLFVSDLLSGINNINCFQKNGNSVSFVCNDKNSGEYQYVGLDLVNGEVEILDFKDSLEMPEYSDGEWLSRMSDLVGNQYLTDSPDNFKKFVLEESDSFWGLLGEPNRIMETSVSMEYGCELTLYDMDGLHLSSVTIENSYMGPIGDPVWIESANGYFFTLIDDKGYDKLYFWDLSKEVEGENLNLADYPDGEVVSKDLYECAKKIGETYGVVINIADQVRVTTSDMSVGLELDEAIIERALGYTEKALSDYPANFFKQLPYGSYSGKIEINLAGKIERYYESDYDAVAFVTNQDGYTALVINIEQSEEEFLSNFYHETSHIIDRKLQYDAEQGINTLYSEERWAALNPEGFEYQNSYASYAEFKDEYFPYLINQYSMTYATEDRAVLFQNAMMEYAYFFNTREFYGRNAKLDYYCECIRESFDTTGWPEITKWEQALIDCDTAEPPYTGKG